MSSARGARAAAARCRCMAAAGPRQPLSPGNNRHVRAGWRRCRHRQRGRVRLGDEGVRALARGRPSLGGAGCGVQRQGSRPERIPGGTRAAAPRAELKLTIAYHDACHLGHAQRITAQPRKLLRDIPGVTLIDIADGGTCCGSAGIYNLVQPEAAAELGARKANAVQATGADLLVSANPGCSLQIAKALAAAGHPLPVAHIAEVLDASIRALPGRSLTAGD